VATLVLVTTGAPIGPVPAGAAPPSAAVTDELSDGQQDILQYRQQVADRASRARSLADPAVIVLPRASPPQTPENAGGGKSKGPRARHDGRRPPVRLPAGRARTVVAFAVDQVGKPYRWAAAGPGAYDCSGLVLAAYAKVGIRIPHQSGEIVGLGRRVRRGELQPADLVLWSGHVAIYIGDGRVVEAANRQDGVRVGPIWGDPITYRRLL